MSSPIALPKFFSNLGPLRVSLLRPSSSTSSAHWLLHRVLSWCHLSKAPPSPSYVTYPCFIPWHPPSLVINLFIFSKTCFCYPRSTGNAAYNWTPSVMSGMSDGGSTMGLWCKGEVVSEYQMPTLSLYWFFLGEISIEPPRTIYLTML